MKTSLTFLLSLVAVAAAHAADPPAAPVQVNALFRVLKTNGTTVVGQAVVTPGGGALASITVSESDALVAANGRCAFNVKYDEVASANATGTVNRLYSNDTLIAQNSAIDLQAGVLKTIWTQPYLYAGLNNVKVVVNATAANPGIGWVRINVVGKCGGTTVAPPPVVTPPAPPPPPAAPAPITPTSAEWNPLYNAWGYSNYGVTQLKTKGYARYADLVRINADLTAVVNAKRVERAAYNELMARWNVIANDPAFKTAMAAVVPAPAKI